MIISGDNDVETWLGEGTALQLYDGQIHDAGWSNELPPGQQCTRQGFGGYFDGDADNVQVPDLGVYTDLTIDVWVKFDSVTGSHPIMASDQWNP